MKRIINLTDGCNPELVLGAKFTYPLGIPIIEAPKKIIIPNGITPFSKRNYSEKKGEAIAFFEKDDEFGDVIIHPDKYLDEFREFEVFIPADCSLYRDASLAAQVTNLYRSRAIGSYYQRNGLNTIPLIRWGNEYTYTTKYFPEKIAFLGAEKHSIVAIGTYGCIGSAIDKHYFKEGLREMLITLEPEVVLVYGSMPKAIFGEFMTMTKFVQYDDWTTRMHKGV